MLDTLGRAPRFSRTPLGQRVRPRPRDLIWFEALQRHGPLTSDYLHAFASQEFPSDKGARHRLRNLFHEGDTPHNGPYLDRPPQQRATDNARANMLVYALNAHSRAALAEAGKMHEHAPFIAPGQWVHDYMSSCITASIEIAARKHGIRFLSHQELVARFGMRYPIGDKVLIPDRLFGLVYPDNTVRIGLLETDRGTETTNTYGYKVKNYQAFIAGGMYKSAMKLTGGVLMFTVTNGERRAQSLLSTAEKITGGANYICVKSIPHFGEWFQPPPILYDLLEKPWSRPGKEPLSLV